MSDQDIREWARNKGQDISPTGRIPKAVRDAYTAEQNDGGVSVTFEDTPMPETVSERRPDVAGDNLGTRARTLLNRTKQTRRTRTSKPKKTYPRMPVDRLIGRAWEGLARFVQPVNLPVARVLAMQAPVAGMILEDEIKGTLVDRLLQPIARTEKHGETAIALIGPPLLVGVLTSKPHLAPVIVPALRESLAVWIDIAGPKIEIQEERAKEFKEKYGDRIDAILEMILAPAEVEIIDQTP